MLWADGVIAAFDLETTGFDAHHDEIVQAALVRVGSGGDVLPGSWVTIVNPGRPIPVEAAAVHGISNERAAREGVTVTDAVARILDDLEALARAGTPVVIFNAPFDLAFMQMRAERVGRALPGVSVIDPLVCDRALDQYRRGRRTLGSMAEHYGCEAQELHDAQNDAVASVAVARAIARAFPDIASLPVADLHQRQVAWYREWAVEFQAYRRRSGTPDATIDAGWPVPDMV
jgi:DNA polymerase III subunit epsilon